MCEAKKSSAKILFHSNNVIFQRQTIDQFNFIFYNVTIIQHNNFYN